jgi:transposase
LPSALLTPPRRTGLAAHQVKDGESIANVVKELGLGDQTLRNWVKAAAEGNLKGAGSKVVTPEAMELSRQRAEVANEDRAIPVDEVGAGLCRKSFRRFASCAWIALTRCRWLARCARASAGSSAR